MLLIYQYYFLYQPLVLNFLYVFCCFTSMYATTFLSYHNGNKITQIFCVIHAIAPYGEVLCQSYNFNKFIFVYVVNIRFIYEG